MSNNEPNLMSKSPNPDKIKNKMEIENKWANKIIKSNPDDIESVFCDELNKLDNPIQIWIKGQVLLNLGIKCADTYMAKANELGYSTNMNENSNIKVTKFNDGTFVFSTKDPILVEKINNLMNESIKQEFQYEVDKIGDFNMFNDEDEKSIKVKKDEYNSDALLNMIKNDNFLKFTFHNLSSGNLNDDLKMIWNNYVKDDLVYKNTIKQYENIQIKEDSNKVVKYDFYNRLNNLINEAKIDNKFDINKIALIISNFKSSSILENHINDISEKIAIKNIVSDLKSKGLYESLNLLKLSISEIISDNGTKKISKHFNIKESTSYILQHLYFKPLINESIKLYDNNGIEFTKLFNIMASVILTNELVS